MSEPCCDFTICDKKLIILMKIYQKIGCFQKIHHIKTEIYKKSSLAQP